jgi:hypothetical protein
MNKISKKNNIKEILPLVWNSYQHMYDVRKNSIQNRTSMLLVVISFLSVLSVTLFTYYKNGLFLIPLLFQLVSFIILLKESFHTGPFVHWFEINDTLKKIEENELNQDTFASLKALEDNTYLYVKDIQKIIGLSISLLFTSVYLILEILNLIYFKNPMEIFLSIDLFVVFIGIILYYKSGTKFDYYTVCESYKKKIEDWLNNPSS